MVPLKSLSSKTERDIILINILSALLVAVLALYPNSPACIILGLPFIMFFPGYMLICALFPREKDLDGVERLALSFGVSIAVTSLIGLMLNHTPLGILLYPVTFSMFSFILLISLVAIYRRRIISSEEVFAPFSQMSISGWFESREITNGSVKFGTEIGNISLGKISNLCTNKYFLYALMSIAFALLALFVKKHYYGFIILTIYTIIGILIYLAITPYKFRLSSEYNTQPIWIYIGLILFFVAYGLSIAYLKFFEPYYSKSLCYYILIGICTSAIFLIAQSNKKAYLKTLLPLLVVLLALNIFLSNYIVFPYGTYASGDTHWQIYNMVLPILENGRIPLGYTYTCFPLHQVFVAILAMTTGLDPVRLYQSATGILYAISALFIYIFGRRVFDSTFGIVSMLMYLTTSEIVYHATHAYQFSYALPIGILVLFCIILLVLPDNVEKIPNSIQQTKVSWVILYLLFLVTLIWTHHFTSTLILQCTLILFLVAALFLKNDSNIRSFCYTSLLLYIVILLAHWMYVSSMLSSLASVINVYHASLFGVANYQTALVSPSSPIVRPFWLSFLDTSGRGIMFMLAIIGSLYGIWKNNIHVLVMAIFGIIGWTLISFGSLIHMPLLLGCRILAVFMVVSIIYLAALGCMVLVKRLGKKGIIICCLLLFMMPIFGLGSTSTGTETSLFLGEETEVTLYDTTADLQSRAWIQRTVPDEAYIRVSEGWVLQYSDKARVYTGLPINTQNQISVSELKFGEYLVLSEHDISGGLRVRGISETAQIAAVKSGEMTTVEAQSLHVRMIKLEDSEINRVDSQLGRVYSNGEINIFVNYSHTTNQVAGA